MNEDFSEIVRRKLSKSPMDVSIPFQKIRDDLIDGCRQENDKGQLDVTLDIMLEFYRTR